MLELLENARINGNTPTFAPKARRSVCFSSHQPSRRRREGRLLTHDHPHCLVFQIYCVYVLYMYLLDVSIRDLKYFCVLFVLFVFLFMLLALLRCYTSIFDGFIFIKNLKILHPGHQPLLCQLEQTAISPFSNYNSLSGLSKLENEEKISLSQLFAKQLHFMPGSTQIS